jgi:hypothetical protein
MGILKGVALKRKGEHLGIVAYLGKGVRVEVRWRKETLVIAI